MSDRRTDIKYLNQDQIKRLFAGISDLRDRALFACIYHYGLRVSEATLLSLKEVDLEHRRIIIHRLKNGYGGERPLFANTAQAIEEYLQMRGRNAPQLFIGRQGGLGRQRIQQMFKHYARLAGIDSSFTVRCLRHSIATHLLEAGCGIEFVQDHLGHVNIQNTMIYAKLTDRRRDAVFQQLENSPAIVKV